ncbi:MAG: O-antigen ligase family protein [Anaerolineae bacterium]
MTGLAQAVPGVRRTPQAGALLPFVELALAFGLAALWYLPIDGTPSLSSGKVALSLLLVAGIWVLRGIGTGFRPGRSAFTLPLGLFMLSAGLAVWTAYAPEEAWRTFWRMVGALGLYWAMAHQPDREHLHTALACVGLGAVALAIYLVAGNPWAQYEVKFALLAEIGSRLAAALAPLRAITLNPNMAGGTLAALLPFFAPLVAHAWDRTRGAATRLRWATGLLWVLLAGIVAATLFLSASRGAWAALACAALLGFCWRLLRWRSNRLGGDPQRRWKGDVALFGAGLFGIALGVGVATIWILLSGTGGAETLRNRMSIQSDALLLTRDYFLTGSGLGAFEMQYAIYALLIHVGYVTYSHNMFVDILVAQGILGLASWVWLLGAGLVSAARTLKGADRTTRWFVEAAVASLVVGSVHALVDSPQYAGRGMLFLLLPFGVLAAVARFPHAAEQALAPIAERARRQWVWGLLAGLVVLGAALGMNWRTVLATLYANLGAVEQSRVELAAYSQEQFAERPMDRVRQDVNLDAAINLLQKAVSLDPSQVTARQRLAAIALSRGAYADARTHMETAWAAGHQDAVTRLLLADALVATGEPERAAGIARGLKWAVPRLQGQLWSRYYASEQWEQARDAATAVLILEPGNAYAAYWAAEAERQLASP